jgi:DHA1 family multidrug resistance protein-like MFS transporter
MVNALVRDAAIGQIIRYVTRNKYLKYPEEEVDFVVPESYSNADALLQKVKSTAPESSADSDGETPGAEQPDATAYEEIHTGNPNEDLEKAETHAESLKIGRTNTSGALGIKRTKTREETLAYTSERFEAERIATIERAATRPIVPAVTNNGDILVDWYTTDDDSNPQNWSLNKKNFSSFIIW